MLLTVAIYPIACKSKELAYFLGQKIMSPPLRIEIIIKLHYALASAVSSLSFWPEDFSIKSPRISASTSVGIRFRNASISNETAFHRVNYTELKFCLMSGLSRSVF